MALSRFPASSTQSRPRRSDSHPLSSLTKLEVASATPSIAPSAADGIPRITSHADDIAVQSALDLPGSLVALPRDRVHFEINGRMNDTAIPRTRKTSNVTIAVRNASRITGPRSG